MIQKIRKYGFFTKGFVYATLGLLTLLAALDLGGKVSDRNGVIVFLEQQVFGKILLIIIALGLLSYAIWRLFKAYFIVKNQTEKKRYLICIDYLFRAVFYSLFALSIFYRIIDLSKQRMSEEKMAAEVLSVNSGQIILYIIAIIIFISAINQFYIVYSKIYLKEVKRNTKKDAYSFLEKSGRFGIISRGVSFLIFAYFIFRAASERNPQKIKGTEAMFSYLQDLTLGNVLMATMSLGFISYGVFQYFNAKYTTN